MNVNGRDGAAGARRGGAASTVVLLAAGLHGCGGAGAPAAPPPALVATGTCLGRVCLGMSEAEALRAIDAGAAPDPERSAAHCYRTAGGVFYSFWVDGEDPARRVTGVLATAGEHCGHPSPIADPGALATCKGVRLGDPESMVTKLHRQAAGAARPEYPWPEAPEGVVQLDDTCAGQDPDAPHTSLYLRGGRVEGLAVWELDS
jgi:hypothetical protein